MMLLLHTQKNASISKPHYTVSSVAYVHRVKKYTAYASLLPENTRVATTLSVGIFGKLNAIAVYDDCLNDQENKLVR